MLQFDNILLVCTANICRSPTAEYVFKSLYAAQSRVDALEQGHEYTPKVFNSAGINAEPGTPIDEQTANVARKHGIIIDDHRAQVLSGSLMAQHDLILVMNDYHKDMVHTRHPEVRGKVFLLGHWLDNTQINDPYRKSQEFYALTFQHIHHACVAWANYIE